MTQRNVFLIGTSHTFQYGVGARWGKVPCTPSQEHAFRELIRAAAISRGVRAIAEELNREGLAEVGKSVSVLESLAEELGLSHLFCEPNRSERAELGIEQENDIRISVFLTGGSDSEVESRIHDQFRKRETAWLQKLTELGNWPVLYVCGANHVSSFSALLAEAGVVCEVLHADWQA